jgi:integrase
MGKRSPNGMGTVVKRSDGRYQAAVYVFTPTGHRIRKYVYGKTWEEANAERLKLLDNNRRGVPSTSSAMTLDRYFDYWLREVAACQLRVSTFARYQALVADYIRPHIGTKKLNHLTPGDVRKLMATLEHAPGKAGRPLSGRTRQFIHAVLRSALQHAVREDLVGRNVAKLVSPPKAESGEIIPLDRQQAREFLAAAQQHWLCALWLLLIMTGLRRGEALGLTWADVDLESGIMRIRRTLQRINGKFVVGEPKSRRSRRIITLPTVCIHALERHREIAVARVDINQRLPVPHQPSDLIFTTRSGRPIDPRSVNKAFARLLKRAGINPSRVHDLRHTCASLLLLDGASDREVMELLGHSSTHITMNIYAHVLNESKRRLAARMDNLLSAD